MDFQDPNHTRIALPEDYNIGLNFQFLLRSPREVLHRLENNNVHKLFDMSGEKFLIRISPGERHFQVECLVGDPDEGQQREILRYIREWFDLDSDLDEFYSLAFSDRLLGPVVSQFRGYRIVGQPDLFESLTWAIIGQQINLQFAYTLKQRFVMKYGESICWQGQEYYSFPRPEVVARLTHADLFPLQFSSQKSKYVQLIAEAFATGEMSRSMLEGLPLVDAKVRLMKIKGIGNWTANYALMKTFRYRDAFPLEDAGIHNAIRNLKKMKRKPTLDEVSRIFRKYKGWEAYATLYLWKSLELPSTLSAKG
jgi:DNA-3-methyladenine glycosylase II